MVNNARLLVTAQPSGRLLFRSQLKRASSYMIGHNAFGLSSYDYCKMDRVELGWEQESGQVQLQTNQNSE